MRLTVKEISEARGFKNAKQLADAAGIRYKSMYPIWNGTARMIGLDTLERLCNTLRVQAGMLFEVVPDDEQLPTAAETLRQNTAGRAKSETKARSTRKARSVGIGASVM